MGFISTLIYTSELILCSTICVHSASGTTFICTLTEEVVLLPPAAGWDASPSQSYPQY